MSGKTNPSKKLPEPALGSGDPTSKLLETLIDLRNKTTDSNGDSHIIWRSTNRPRMPRAVPFRDILQSEKARKEKINNDIKESDQKLKKITLICLFILLFLETAVIFVLIFMQGLKAWGFDIDTISLRIIIVATLVQISAMLTIAVRHLFPTGTPSKNDP